jgi:hypothetical protein
MAIKFNEVRTKLGLDDTFTFGAWNNYTVAEVIEIKPDYIKWLIKEGKQFYPSVHEKLAIVKHSIIEDLRYLPNIDDWFDDVPF